MAQVLPLSKKVYRELQPHCTNSKPTLEVVRFSISLEPTLRNCLGIHFQECKGWISVSPSISCTCEISRGPVAITRLNFGNSSSLVIDLLMDLFRGAVFHHGQVHENCPLALMGRFPSLMGRFPTLMGRFPECLNGPFSLLKFPWKTAH